MTPGSKYQSEGGVSEDEEDSSPNAEFREYVERPDLDIEELQGVSSANLLLKLEEIETTVRHN